VTNPNSRIVHFIEWQPEELPEGYTLDISPLVNVISIPDFMARCVVSQLTGDLEHVIVYANQGYGATPDEAAYDAYKRALYFFHHRTLPPPTFTREDPADPFEPVHHDGYTIIPEAEDY
jgi:hypothetical protein